MRALVIATMAKPNVFLTGAGGRTGKLVFKRLKARPEFGTVKGLVRRQEQKDELGDGAVVGDALKPETFIDEMQGGNKLIILTSAVPKMRPPANPSDQPEWYFEPGQEPEQVDWVGQRNQIDAAKRLGYDQVVLVSSMGVTKPDHPLNKLGNGNILFFKKMAAEYLVSSGVPYTIIHPGGLLDKEGGHRELLVGKGDAFLDAPDHPRVVPRADLAEVVIQALLNPEAKNKCFDLVSREEGEGTPTRTAAQFDVLFDQTTAGL